MITMRRTKKFTGYATLMVRSTIYCSLSLSLSLSLSIYLSLSHTCRLVMCGSINGIGDVAGSIPSLFKHSVLLYKLHSFFAIYFSLSFFTPAVGLENFVQLTFSNSLLTIKSEPFRPCFLPFTQNIFRQPMPENS